MRPIFPEDASKDPVAAVLLHSLRLTYHKHSDKRLSGTFVTLSDGALDQLAEQVERAKTKRASIKRAFRASRCPIVEE